MIALTCSKNGHIIMIKAEEKPEINEYDKIIMSAMALFFSQRSDMGNIDGFKHICFNDLMEFIIKILSNASKIDNKTELKKFKKEIESRFQFIDVDGNICKNKKKFCISIINNIFNLKNLTAV